MATSVPVGEYRARMREWHERVAHGQDIVVTENGQPRVRVTAADDESILARLERDGLLRRARPRAPADAIPSVVASANVSDIVSHQRDR